VRVARELSSAFPDGVYMVQLSALRDPELLASTVAAVIGVAGQFAEGQPDEIVDYLCGKRVLLILDTCEHLIDACAMFADMLLRGAEGPLLLATSRQALDIPGEVVYPIPPLPVPDDGGDAVALFADRVSAAVPGFTITAEVLPKIVQLCQGLDGIPLAIELAAVRLRAVGLEELLARLGDRLRLLGSGSRRTTERHQTLRMTIAWSYDLCSPAEKVMWTRLSVFAGEFGLDAVESVCAGDPLGDDIIDTLIGLVDKSIVLRADSVDSAGGARYRMLDAVREYGSELLADPDIYRRRHLSYYLEVARKFEPAFLSGQQCAWIDRIARDQFNIRVALEYCLTSGQALPGLELATSCWGFWMSIGRLAEGSYWLQRLLEQAPESAPQRVRGLWLASWFLSCQGDYAASAVLRAEAREIVGLLGNREELLRPLTLGTDVLRGLRRVLTGEYAQALAVCDEALGRLPAGEKWMRGSVLWIKSLALWFTRSLADCADCHREGLRIKLAFGDLMSVACHLEGLAWLAADEGDHERTAILQGAADRMWGQAAREPRFGVPVLHAERVRAEGTARDGLGEEGYAERYTVGGAVSTEDVARYALGEPLREPLMEAASAATRAAARPGARAGAGSYVGARAGAHIGTKGSIGARGGDAGSVDGAGGAVRGVVGGSVGGSAGTAGGAGDVVRGAGAGDARGEAWGMLTAREREVAVLVADGLTNKDIAMRLVVSKRTVDAHVEHMLAKLGFSSRVQIAALATAATSGSLGADGSGGGGGSPGAGAVVPSQRPAADTPAVRREDTG
jgi:non-specific serine/threonine protein kinase